MRFSAGTSEESGQPSWWLYDDDETPEGWAGEMFDSPSNAKRAAQDFKAGASTARYETYKDAAGKWRWRAWRSSDKVARSSGTFPDEAAAQQSAHKVRDNAVKATGP